MYCLVRCFLLVFIRRYVFQSGTVTGLHCPCRDDLHTRGFKLASDLEACGNFLFLRTCFNDSYLKFNSHINLYMMKCRCV